MGRIVDTRASGYPMIPGQPFTEYNADEEFLYQMEKYFHGLMKFDIISRKGSKTKRVDFLLRGSFPENEFSDNYFYVYVFILYEGGNGRAHDDELRTQLGSHNVWSPDLGESKVATDFRDSSSTDLTNKECYCIGIYKQDDRCHDVLFVGMPAEVLCKSENEQINPTSAFQTYGELAREAYINGIYLHEKRFSASSTNNLVLFKPQYFLWYMKHRDELHIGDIDKANQIVKDTLMATSKSAEIHVCENQSSQITAYLAALRTKPFMLLAGISGTGKSRIVRKLAQATVTKDLQEADGYKGEDFENDRWTLHSPANFELIQVKPNWHNSMDVIGYLSNIPSPHYVFTPFIEFVVKAWQHPKVPFFLCLDEMNLAPVEEYFAEFLSAIESRSFEDGKYLTDPIIKPFNSFGKAKDEKGEETNVGDMMVNTLFPKFKASDTESDVAKLIKHFRTKGLTLPKNLIVIGTVNMDETTFSFSRKVLDRAMSVEMNEVNYGSFLEDTTDDDIKLIVKAFEEEKYGRGVALNALLVDRHIEAKEVKKELGDNAKFVIAYLTNVNAILEGTPFKLGYRTANEALIYLRTAQEFGQADRVAALDNFTLMKILSRIEGDENKLKITDSEADKERLNKSHVDCERAKSHGDLNVLTALREIIVQQLGEYYNIEEEVTLEEGDEQNDKMAEGEQVGEAALQVPREEHGEKLKSIKKIDNMLSQLKRDHFVSYWN